jgi:putative proteasome-type protease
MTYCVGVSTKDGLVFCSDSRTNAGADMLSSYSKMHIITPAEDRVFVILASGNLATTQSIIQRINQEMEETDKPSLNNCKRMVDAARYIGQICREEHETTKEAAATSGIDTSVTFIFGGQIRGEPTALYMVYSAGNFITDSDETPYLQIGESKYGKPILDRILSRETSLEDAARCTIVSMDSTIKSNATVGPPIEVLVYQQDSFDISHYIKMEEDDEYLRKIKQAWNEALNSAFSKLPLFHWEKRATTTSNLHAITEIFHDQ